MTKAELVEEVSRVSDLTKKHSEVIVDTVFKSIIDALHRGEKIELRGFGSFRLRKREPRKGRNPKTGDKVDVPPKKVPYFKPGKELKELINREDEATASSAAASIDQIPGVASQGVARVDHLWSPWRLHYVTSEKATGCVFCQRRADPANGVERDPLVVFEGTLAYVILNRYPYNNGHLMVVPNRHLPALVDLSVDELNEVALLTQRSEAVLREAYKLEGINVGINLGKPAGGGIPGHLHVHLVPRWTGDTNFMTVVGDTRVLPEDLASTASRLAPIFERLSR